MRYYEKMWLLSYKIKDLRKVLRFWCSRYSEPPFFLKEVKNIAVQ